jgi:hypothetical protein
MIEVLDVPPPGGKLAIEWDKVTGVAPRYPPVFDDQDQEITPGTVVLYGLAHWTVPVNGSFDEMVARWRKATGK